VTYQFCSGSALLLVGLLSSHTKDSASSLTLPGLPEVASSEFKEFCVGGRGFHETIDENNLWVIEKYY